MINASLPKMPCRFPLLQLQLSEVLGLTDVLSPIVQLFVPVTAFASKNRINFQSPSRTLAPGVPP
jgi:hypothetical protein